MSPDPIADMLIVLDDHPSSRAGLEFARRYATAPLALASWNAATDDLGLPVQTSIASDPTIPEALRLAAQRGIGFVAMRRDLADPDRLLSDLLVAAAQNTDDAIPGFAILLADGEPRPVQRILAVVDQRNSAGSGLAVLMAVSAARRTEAAMDVLVLGPNPEPDPASPHASLLAINREQELFDQAMQLARDEGITATWLTVEDPADPWAVVVDQLGQEPYDLVIDDLGEVNLGGRIGLSRSLEGVLAPGSVGEMPRRLLAESDTPLLLIIDEVRLGMTPARMFKVGAVAALALGIVTPAAATTAAAVASPANPQDDVEGLIKDLEEALGIDSGVGGAVEPQTAEEERAADAAQSSRGSRDEPPSEEGASEEEATPEQSGGQEPVQAQAAKADTGEADTEQADAKSDDEDDEAPEPPKGGAQPDDVAEVRSEAEQAEQALAKDKKQKKEAQEDAEEAEQDLAKAQERAHAALEDLQTAQLNYEAAHAQARQTRTSAVGGVLPGGPTVEDAHAATIMEQSAQQALTAATIEGEAALHELTTTEAHVEEASAEVDKRAEDVSQSKAEYEAAQETVEVYEESLAETRQSPIEGGYDLTARYGASGGYWSGGVHTGLDFACPSGTDVSAAASGTVVEAGYDGAYGNRVVIEHEDGYTTTYNHLSDIDVSVGQEVSTGDHIGDVGTTGNVTGPHLHFEVLHNGEFVNPEAWLGW